MTLNPRSSYSLILVCLVLLTACKETVKKTSGEYYKTMTVTTADQTLQTTYPATLKGRQSVEIRPQVSGTITSIRINEGDAVRKGQVLFVIDQVPYKAAMETAAANVKSAEAKLETARLNASSREQLHKENVVSDFDYQTACNQLLEAEAALAQAEAALTNAANNLSYTEVKSPVNGVASMIPYRVGALVSSSISEPLVTVSDDTQMHAYFSMAENQMLDLISEYGSLEEAKVKMPDVTLIMSNGIEYESAGRIDAISGTVDENTGAVSLRASFPNEGRLLRHGGSARISIPAVHKDRVVIPQAATYELQNKVFVWKIVDGKTKSAPISVHKHNDGKNHIVLGGLEAGEEIIAEGAGLLREGVSVIREENNQPAK